MPTELRGQLTVQPFRNKSLCQGESTAAHYFPTTPTQTVVAAGDLLLSPPRHRPAFDACCMLVPHSKKWVDPFGKRLLREELMLNERDLAHLLLEAGPSVSTSTVQLSEMRSAVQNHVRGSQLPLAHTQHEARVLYVDFDGASSLAELAQDDTLKRLASACTAAQYCEQIVRQLRQLSDGANSRSR